LHNRKTVLLMEESK